MKGLKLDLLIWASFCCLAADCWLLLAYVGVEDKVNNFLGLAGSALIMLMWAIWFGIIIFPPISRAGRIALWVIGSVMLIILFVLIYLHSW